MAFQRWRWWLIDGRWSLVFSLWCCSDWGVGWGSIPVVLRDDFRERGTTTWDVIGAVG